MAQDMISTTGGEDPLDAAANEASGRRFRLLNPYQWARILFLGAAILSIVLFFWASRLFDIPVHSREHETLLSQPSPAAAFVVLAGTFVLSTALSTVITGRIRFNSGLVAACLGLLTPSVRGGTMRSVVHDALAHDRSRLFLGLALETALLGALIGVCWFVLRRLHQEDWIQDREGNIESDALDSAQNELSALGLQVVNTALLILLLCPTEDKWQAIIGVGVAAWGGAASGHYLFATSPRGWYWLPPILVGIIGYLLAYGGIGGLQTADLTGSFAGLARPVPLDYAGAGVAGAIVGHWMARRWLREREAAAQAAAKPVV